MPRGKDFCPFEKDYFPIGQFKVIDGTRIHDVDPRHRATDGVLVRAEEEKIIPVANFAFGPFDEGDE
jgi:hypothetical protein